MKPLGKWFRHGVWNVLEHALSRGLDAFATVALLWFVSPETFSQLALAQAYVAPALFFFICPETSFYREFSAWSAEGRGKMLARIRAFRRFAWTKGALAFLLAGTIAALFPSPIGSSFDWGERFLSILWAFSLPLTPQIAGADREFLRLNLDLRELNAVTVFQRAFYLAALLLASLVFSASLVSLAAVGVLSAVFTAWLARSFVERRFSGIVPERVPESDFVHLLRETVRGFSFWNHISGIVVGWTQTLDLFLLGWLRTPMGIVGLYGIGLKLANFSLAIPYAVSNLYNVYLGRTSAPQDNEGRRREARSLLKFSSALAFFTALQALIFWKLSPWILEVLSRGRWALSDQARIVQWLQWILPASAVFGACLFWTGWLSIRFSFRRLVFGVYLPWGGMALILYAWNAYHGGVDAAARTNLSVVGVFVVLLAFATAFRKKL
jgi:hypothetical protein